MCRGKKSGGQRRSEVVVYAQIGSKQVIQARMAKTGRVAGGENPIRIQTPQGGMGDE